MSALSEKVRPALFTAMNVTDVLSLAIGGVHYQVAPTQISTEDGVGNETVSDIEYPFVVFRRYPADVHYALANNNVGERDEWLIKALVDEDSSADKEPPELAEDILTACETAIGTALTITGGTVSRVRRTREMPDYIEQLNDRQVWHHGFFLEVFANAS